MRIIYIANSRIPTEKAYGVSVVKTCEALAREGARITLLVPDVRNTAGKDLFSYYGIDRIFDVQLIPALDAVARGWRYGFLVNQISFSLAVFFSFHLLRKGDIVITRDEASGILLRFRGFSVFYDMHGFPERKFWIWRVFLRKMSGIFTTNEWKIRECRAHFGISEDKMVVARNGFDPALFLQTENGKLLREKYRISAAMPIVLYTGHLYDWKGAYILGETAKFLPSVAFVFVGGTYYDIPPFKERFSKLPNIFCLGYRPHREIPSLLRMADILVLPNSQYSKTSRFSVYSRNDTSPIKLFEYMGSGRPIIASDLPSIREILNKTNAVLVKPDSPDDLKSGINALLGDMKRAHEVAKMALNDVKKYTWRERAKTMLGFIRKQ